MDGLAALLPLLENEMALRVRRVEIVVKVVRGRVRAHLGQVEINDLEQTIKVPNFGSASHFPNYKFLI